MAQAQRAAQREEARETPGRGLRGRHGLFADASALMHAARGIRQELAAATATGADEAELLVQGAIAAGIEGGPRSGARGGPAGAQASAGGERRRRADVASATARRPEPWREGRGMKAITVPEKLLSRQPWALRHYFHSTADSGI
jgi:hypothetical protein